MTRREIKIVESDLRDVSLRCAVLDYQDAQKEGHPINTTCIQESIDLLKGMLEKEKVLA